MDLSQALQQVEEYNKQGILCSLSYLPVIKTSSGQIMREVEEYGRILEKISQKKLNCDITVKMHQLGIYGREGLAEAAVERIVYLAKQYGVFVWVDMERPDTVDATVEIFRVLAQKHDNLGICLQAYLKRSERDMRLFLSRSVPIRLVKGFYRQHDFKSWQEVSENYERLMGEILRKSVKPAIATHDLRLIEKAKEIVKSEGIKNAEFQFFSGVRDDLARQLVKEGYRVRIYIPYGNLWRFLWRGLRTFDLFHQVERMLGLMPWS